MKKFTLFTLMLFFSSMIFAQYSANNYSESSPNASSTIEKGAKGAKGAWQVQFNYDVSYQSYIAGAECDGNYFYTTVWSTTAANAGYFYKYSITTGALVDSFTIAGVSGLRDLAYDGQYFYGGKNTALFYKMDFNSTPPSLKKTINCPTGTTVRNICYESDSNAFWVGGWATDLKLIDTNGTLLRTIPAATHGLTSTYGTAYDTITSGGPYIWSISATSASNTTITQIDATTGLPTGITHDCTSDICIAGELGGGLWIEPGIITSTATLGGLIQNEKLFGYNLASVVPDSFDLAVNTIDVNPLVPIGNAVTIGGEIKNMGLITITALDLHYRIDGGTVNTDNLSGLSIAQNTAYNYAHTTTWTPTTGTHTIDVWVSNPNGHADQFTANDSLSATATGYDPASAVQRIPLHECFTASTCPPCNAGNANLKSIFNANPNKFTCVKYQTAGPGTGDPYYTAEGGSRSTYYSNQYVPWTYVDGGYNCNSGSYTSTLLNTAYAVPSFVDITASYQVVGQTVSVYATIDPKIDVPGTIKFYVAIIENKTTQNKKTNGETEFFYVMKKMIPNANGTSIGPLTSGTAVSFDGHHEFKGSFRLPNSAQDPIDHTIEHSVEEFSDLNVVVWVQNTSTKEVYQSAWATNNVSINENPSKNGIIELFPNPANSQAYVRYLLEDNQNVNIKIYNILGEVVYSENKGYENSGYHTTVLDVNNFSEGLYIVKLTVGNNIFTKKLNIN